MKLDVLAETYAVCRLDPQGGLAEWALPPARARLWSLTVTADEISLVCPAAAVPDGPLCEAGWRALRVAGPLDFGLVGILAELSGLLARAGVSLFALSTYDTDYLLVKAEALEAACDALRAGGHQLEG